jgi:hypothetical protein
MFRLMGTVGSRLITMRITGRYRMTCFSIRLGCQEGSRDDL